MALFQKRPDYGSRISFSTYGLQKTLLIVGLGNLGPSYELTRHNIGFMCLDEFARLSSFDPWTHKTDFKCHLTMQTINDTRVILCKPTTYMNLSGEAVQAVAHFYKVSNERIIAVHDELAIDFGYIRTRVGGSSAGHNGIKSLTQHCGQGYGRVRIGIGPKTPDQIDSADYVLQKFSTAEQNVLPKLLREVSAILSEYTYGSAITADTRSFL
jgi:PTH1 family peptidyl-tRNA hydrolase